MDNNPYENLDQDLFRDLNESPRLLQETFKIIRGRLHLDQQEMADLAGLARPSISRIENGVTTNPKQDTLATLCTNIATQYGAYLSFASLLEAARLSAPERWAGRYDIIVRFEDWFDKLPDDKKAHLSYILEMLMRAVD